VVEVRSEPEPHIGTPTRLFRTSFVDTEGQSYDVSPDGQRILLLKSVEPDSAQRLIHVVHNFDDELRRLVPTD